MAIDPNIELLESVYADWARGDYSRADYLDPDVEFVTDFPEHMTYRGPEGLRKGWSYFLSAWEDFTSEAEEILPAPGGEGRYVVLVRLRGLGRESGVPIEGAGANIITIRNGKFVYLELIWDRDAALASVGLQDG